MAKKKFSNWGISLLGGIYQVIVGERPSSQYGLPAPSEPLLPSIDLSEAIENGEPNLFSVLQWEYGLLQTLYGRADDIATIKDWVKSGQKSASVRLVTGPGGAGKTTLAAAVARELKQDGWTAGFIPSSNTCHFDVVGNGLFLILDYPEERTALTEAIFKKISELEGLEFPIRVLLLSRRDHLAWQPSADVLKGRFGLHAIANLTPLSIDQGQQLITEAATRLSRALNREVPELNGARAWLAGDATNALPLIAAAAAVHAVLEPKAAFGLKNGSLLLELARRERRRVRGISKALGLAGGGLTNLLALAVLGDGLDEKAIIDLRDAGAVGRMDVDLVDALSHTPWWASGRLQPPQPDKLGAAFMELALFTPEFPNGRSELAKWLLLSLAEGATNFGDRLSRIMFDVSMLKAEQPVSHPIYERLKEMLNCDRAKCATIFERVAMQGATPWSASFAAEVAEVLATQRDDKDYVAGVLSNASGFFAQSGQAERALEASERAVAIGCELAQKRSARYLPIFITYLLNHSSNLMEQGYLVKALETIELAVTLNRGLTRRHSENSRYELAWALDNLGGCLTTMERLPEALEACNEAVAIYQDLAGTNPELFEEKLAASLVNLSRCLRCLGRDREALAANARALVLYRELARSRPDAFRHYLAIVLAGRGRILMALGRSENAIESYAEGLKTIKPTFLALPHAFANKAIGILDDYKSACRQAGVRASAEISSPITQKLIEIGYIEIVRTGVDQDSELARQT